jgi:hypothetical protein
MEQLQSCFDVLTLESAECFFEKNAEKLSSDGYVICNGVSVETWNCFLDQREEDLPIPLRFIEYYDGKIIIIELPSGDHEEFIQEFVSKFVGRSGNSDAIGKRGSIRASRGGSAARKEADATFGPRRTTPHHDRNRLPNHHPELSRRERYQFWITFAVEVGVSQSWSSLDRAAEWWEGYNGIQYILCIRVQPVEQSADFKFYDLSGRRRRVVEGHVPPPTRRSRTTITLDTRKLLAIPDHRPVPDGMDNTCTVDLQEILELIFAPSSDSESADEEL